MKKLILVLILLAIEVFPQVTSPSGYTTNYGFRKWTQGANPSADSINANWDGVDGYIKVAYDSAQNKVNLYTNQTIVSGLKSISGGGISLQGGRLFFGNNTATSPLYLGELCPTTSRTYLTYTSNLATDTLATLANIRSGAGGYATLAGTETFTGAKTFSEKLITSDDVLYTRENISVITTSFSADAITFGYLIPDTPGYTVTTINGGQNGKIIYLVNSTSDNVILDDGTGNLQLAGDFTMDQYDSITLLYDSNSSQWIEISRSNN